MVMAIISCCVVCAGIDFIAGLAIGKNKEK